MQRRHQKVIEEAPAPGMTPQRRNAMGEAAIAAAKAVGYVGAGTVEFIAEPDGSFYFMEMNTRLQVEHPVTEMITGLDLVEWQLRVANGEPLPMQQDALRIDGHSIEARIYAENPDKGFLPSTGTLRHLRTPEHVSFCVHAPGASETAAVRIDSGVRAGDAISPFYDPMIAKLIVWGADREQAIARMSAALTEFEVVGLASNIGFLQRLMCNSAFAGADLDTGLIERERKMLLPERGQPDARLLASAVAALLAIESANAQALRAADLTQAANPWSRIDGWRLGGRISRNFEFTVGKQPAQVQVEYAPGGFTVHAAGETICLSALVHDGSSKRLRGLMGSEAFEIGAVLDRETLHLFTAQGPQALGYASPLAHAGDDADEGGSLTAPMPGKVIALLCEKGAKVTRGQPLLVMEAMKMEHTLSAPASGIVEELLYAVGDQVTEGAQLIGFRAN